MPLSLLPLLTALLPAVGIHVSYLLAASEGQIPWCFVYLDGCTSISSTGRLPPGSFVFRGTVIPGAVLLMLYWVLCHAWLRQLGCRYPGLSRAMAVSGVVAGAALIVYAVALGSIGSGYALQRRIGVSLFYFLTFGNQALLTLQLALVRRHASAAVGAATFRALAVLSGLTLAGAVSSLLFGFLDPDYHSYDDAFEWSITLLMLAHVFASAFAWRASRFRARLELRGG